MLSESALYKALKVDDLETITEHVPLQYSVDYIFTRFFACSVPMLRHGPPLVAVAAYLKAVNCFKYLLANDCRLDVVDSAQTSLASFAVAGGDMGILELLSDHNVSFAGTLFTAAEYGHFDVFMWIFTTQFEDPTQRRKDSTTVLHSAAKSGNWELIKFLLEQIRDVLEIKDIFELTSALKQHTCLVEEEEEEELTDSSTWN